MASLCSLALTVNLGCAPVFSASTRPHWVRGFPTHSSSPPGKQCRIDFSKNRVSPRTTQSCPRTDSVFWCFLVSAERLVLENCTVVPLSIPTYYLGWAWQANVEINCTVSNWFYSIDLCSWYCRVLLSWVMRRVVLAWFNQVFIKMQWKVTA